VGKSSRLHRQAVLEGRELPYRSTQRRVVRYTEEKLIKAPIPFKESIPFESSEMLFIVDRSNGKVEYLNSGQADELQRALKLHKDIILSKVMGLEVVTTKHMLELLDKHNVPLIVLSPADKDKHE